MSNKFSALVRVRAIDTETKLSTTTHIKPEYCDTEFIAEALGADAGNRYAYKKLKQICDKLNRAVGINGLVIKPEPIFRYRFPKDGPRVTLLNHQRLINRVAVVSPLSYPSVYNGSQFYKVVGYDSTHGAILCPLTDDTTIQLVRSKRAFVLNDPPHEIPNCSWGWAKWSAVVAQVEKIMGDNSCHIYPPIPKYGKHYER